ncbi:MAG: hypothetical protein N2690_03145, partial [Rhodocyclaceae bacterium]|nr:hypothetical protein [Rhodocyclaceae bacterium]
APDPSQLPLAAFSSRLTTQPVWAKGGRSISRLCAARYEATRRIRALPGGTEVKIVALTASAFEEDRAAILAAGCDEFVKKPLEAEQLFAVMARLRGLRFCYAAAPPSEAPAASLTVDLSDLPAELRAALRDAAERLDVAAARALIVPLRTCHAQQAEALERLIDGYRFDRVIELCDRAS